MTDPTAYRIDAGRTANRDLEPADRSRYTQVRLTVTRELGGRASVSVVARAVGSGRLRDVLLHRTGIPLPPGSPESQDPYAALAAALAHVLSGHEATTRDSPKA